MGEKLSYGNALVQLCSFQRGLCRRTSQPTVPKGEQDCTQGVEGYQWISHLHHHSVFHRCQNQIPEGNICDSTLFPITSIQAAQGFWWRSLVCSLKVAGKIFFPARPPFSLKDTALRVKKRHSNVTSPFGGGEALMVMCEAAWVHEGPPFPGCFNGTVIAYEVAASTLQGEKGD